MLIATQNKEENQYVGYCILQNKYVQWAKILDGRFVFLIGNGTQMTCFYFEEDSFWKEQKEAIAQFAVQVNFG